MRISSGSAVIEYVLPIALIGIVVGLGMYYMFSDNKLQSYFANSSGMKVDKATGKMSNDFESTSELIAKGSGPFGGTAETPAMECINGNCTIDFGGFALAGIPENYTEIIHTTGASGGTEKASELLMELASKLEVDEQTKNDIKKLAQLGFQIAQIEQEIENINVSINPRTVEKQGTGRFRNTTSTVQEYISYDKALQYQQPLRDLSTQLKNGDIVQEYNKTKELLENTLASTYNINDENVKALLTVLSSEIIDLKDNVSTKADQLISKLDKAPSCSGRACVGKSTGERDFKPDSNNFFTKDIVRTDLDSHIICKTGHGESDLKKRHCH